MQISQFISNLIANYMSDHLKQQQFNEIQFLNSFIISPEQLISQVRSSSTRLSTSHPFQCPQAAINSPTQTDRQTDGPVADMSAHDLSLSSINAIIMKINIKDALILTSSIYLPLGPNRRAGVVHLSVAHADSVPAGRYTAHHESDTRMYTSCDVHGECVCFQFKSRRQASRRATIARLPAAY